MVSFELSDPSNDIDDKEIFEPFPDEGTTRRNGDQTPHCSCGRFARFLGIQHYYNGNYDCARMSVECKHCGVVDIELV